MSDKNFIAKTGFAAGEFVIDSVSGSFNSSVAGIKQIKINLGLTNPDGTGGIIVPSGPGGTQPTSPTTGTIWFNTTTNLLEVWTGTEWVPVALMDIDGGTY
jgi:hypothetical protein